MINWDCGKKDMVVITKIVERAMTMQGGVDKTSLMMDITACHVNGCPLRLAELLKADDFNFAHDVFGIQRKIDRRTGKINDGFSPRFSK